MQKMKTFDKKYNIISLITALLIFISCNDTWNDHYSYDKTLTSDQTLWELINNDENLSDFAEVLKATNHFSNRKYTNITYDQILGGDQVYTVIAPVNGTFNKDSLLALCETVSGDSLVEAFFVKNHIGRYPYTLSAGKVQDLKLLNGKVKKLDGLKVEEYDVAVSNKPANNGVLHVVNSPLSFYYNIYEFLCSDKEISSLGSFFSFYQKDSLDENASISSGIVDGVPVYVDSVMIQKNYLFDILGPVNNEDSLYIVMAPTDNAWNEAYERISPYFNYSYLDKADSLQEYWTKQSIVQDIVFSQNVQKSMKDSLISTRYTIHEPEYHVFYNPYEPGGIFSDISSQTVCSNGIVNKVDIWPFDIDSVFFTPIKAEAERESNIIDYKYCTYIVRWVGNDSISGNAYLHVIPSSTSSYVTFEIPNTLSGKYDICVVCAPLSVYKTPVTAADSAECAKPYMFMATLTYKNASGRDMTYKCTTSGSTRFTNDPWRMDTVCVAESFSFPTCNYKQKDVTVRLQIETTKSPTTQSRNYNKEMFIDCIYLSPRKD